MIERSVGRLTNADMQSLSDYIKKLRHDYAEKHNQS
jgi:cytochrome c553